jgi:hypothetical protein
MYALSNCLSYSKRQLLTQKTSAASKRCLLGAKWLMQVIFTSSEGKKKKQETVHEKTNYIYVHMYVGSTGTPRCLNGVGKFCFVRVIMQLIHN